MSLLLVLLTRTVTVTVTAHPPSILVTGRKGMKSE